MKHNKTIVSIIIPFKGRLELVREALKSVFNQKNVLLSNIEIILVEDYEQNKNDRKILKKEFPNIKIISNQFEEGPGGGRQSGLKHAKGDYITFLDSDDALEPLFLSKMLKAPSKDTDASGAVCMSKAHFEKGFKPKDRFRLYPLMAIRDISLFIAYFLNKQNIFPNSFYLCQISHMIFRSSVIKKLRFNYQYRRGGEDWDFFVKVLQSGPIKIVPSRALRFRYSPGSSTYQPIQLQNKWRSYSLLAQNLPDSFKKGVYYQLFLYYIKSFGGKNAPSI